MHIEFLVEEESAEEVFKELIPKILGIDISFKIHPFQGKPDLLRKLPIRLKGYSNMIKTNQNLRVVVLIDEDRQDCNELKARLENDAMQSGLITKSASKNGQFHVLNRIAIEELEAWFFGDISALRANYPRISASLPNRARYRDPDNILGGTWEALERVLQTAGYHPSGLPKKEVARNIAPFMNPATNTSRSFQVFRDGLLSLTTTV